MLPDPLDQEHEKADEADTTAPHILYCLSDASTERLIQDNVYLPLYVHSLTHSPTRVNETTATKRGQIDVASLKDKTKTMQAASRTYLCYELLVV